MTKDEYNKKLNAIWDNGQVDWISEVCLLSDSYIDELLAENAKLREDNKILVDQMNNMQIECNLLHSHYTALDNIVNAWEEPSLDAIALQPNQEVVTWHDYPDEQPDMTDKGGFKNKKVLIKYRYENAPEELVGIDTYWESPYIDGFESTCDPNVSVLAWAYLPKGVK